MSLRRANSARSFHSNDENCPSGVDSSKRVTTPKAATRRPLGDVTNSTDIQSRKPVQKRPFSKGRRLSKSGSAPALVIPETPRTDVEDDLIDVPAAVERFRTALTNHDLNLTSFFGELLGETGEFEEAICKKPVIKKNMHKDNYNSLKAIFFELRDAAKHSLKQRKAFISSVAPLQEEMEMYMKRKDEELVAQRVAHEKAAAAWEEDRKNLVQECQHKLDTMDKVREHILQAKELREQELSNLIEMRHNELKAMTAKYETTQDAYIQTREELSAVKATLAAKEEEVEVAVRERRNCKTEFDAYKEFQGATSENQTQAIADLKNSVADLTVKVQEKSHQVEVKQIMVNENQESIEKLKQMLLAEEQRRRDVHNALQELKGNIRVFSRCRPALPGQRSGLTCNTSAGRVSLQYTNDTFDKTNDYHFSFDRVFDQDATQEDVFEEVSDLVQSALDGYKVCIFAYGQTGSGKTHTMQGPQNDPTAWGVIPRSLSQIVKTAIGMRNKGWTWNFHASFLEVYNETIRDLLHTDTDGPSKTHTIIHDNAWGFVVTDMTTKEVTSTDESDALDQIRNLMAIASRQRSVGSTQMNDQSSRSHSLFSLYLHGINSSQGTELYGALHLVDLAGSERLDKSGAEGSRLKETQNINKSLSSLADVFLAKSENRNHVPFRNSKLTHLLEPCLSGQGKTLMMLNVAPEETHSHETLCSLRFAKQVSQCHTGGKPKKSVKTVGAASSSSTRPQTPQGSRPQTPQGSRPNSSRSNFGRSTNCFGN